MLSLLALTMMMIWTLTGFKLQIVRTQTDRLCEITDQLIDVLNVVLIRRKLVGSVHGIDVELNA